MQQLQQVVAKVAEMIVVKKEEAEMAETAAEQAEVADQEDPQHHLSALTASRMDTILLTAITEEAATT